MLAREGALRRHRRTILLIFAAMLVVQITAACTSGVGSPSSAAAAGSSASPVNLTVYAASSLTGAFSALAVAYGHDTPGSTITLSLGASTTLRAQIEQGAPADVFASADTANPQKLADEGLAIGAPKAFAANLLTIIAPLTGSSLVTKPADLARAGLKIVGAGDNVPITMYANQLIANLAKEPGYPPGFAAKVAANIVSREDNVKAVVAKVELGEGDAAVVYVTDARASTRVRTIDVPATANVPAAYAAVVVKGSQHASEAQAFLDWLTSPHAQSILSDFGFLPPP
jgi:molybdate transport system substrate-binding protein